MSFEESLGVAFDWSPSTHWLLHTLVVTALLGISFVVCKLIVTSANNPGKSSTPPIPPGPKGKWFNPGLHSPLRYAEMTEVYGPVFSFRQGKNIFIVIGRYQAAVDIMQKHGADLVDRPQMVAASDIVSGGMRTLLTPAGERLRRLRRFAASLIMTMTYGKTSPTYYSDPEVQEINRNGARLGTLTQIGARSHIVDVYPILRHIPWFTSTLRKWHNDELDLFTRQLEAAREQLSSNSTPPCFVSYLLEHQEEYGLSDDELAYLAGSMFGAGSETVLRRKTASAISFVIMAAAMFPEEQAKVQVELNRVIGQERVPKADEQAVLPRVTAFALECFRWRPTSWGSFAHRATKDIFWNNYLIPAGATVIGNHWSIGLDPEVYPDPTAFKPDRWLDANGRIREDLTYFTYGFGRRVCPGQHLANNSLYLSTALILWAFKISENPSRPINSMDFSHGQSIRPNPFAVNFEPRVGNIEELIGASLSQ
ncbi:cytochrome P450 [Irpex rosettiformis]|uniref:Cytochrome P450 n=1 Tax=Irpex rosettiformis TaxID=378272 RepID=A0ACB8TXB2_9APHY|nr:cytochrome P450 [Irpex rosettiformis]